MGKYDDQERHDSELNSNDSKVEFIDQSTAVVHLPSSNQETKDPPPKDAKIPWRSRLILDKEDVPKPKSQHNAMVYLTYAPAAAGVFRFNLFSWKVEVDKRPNWDPTGSDEFPREMTDNDITRAQAWLELQGIFVSQTATLAAINAAAQHYAHDPLVEYLEGLTWDGKPRIATWLQDYFGVPASEYISAISPKFLIGAVARAMVPGCQMDNMLVMEGNQGILKSSAIRALFSDDWVTDEIHTLGSKDAAMQLHGHWGVEISEMQAMSKAEAKSQKEWITRRADKYRPPYGKVPVTSRRRCVLMGTLNPESGYLKDSTGGRRFWPVECRKIKIEALAKDRDQLWAEAFQAWQGGEKWWLDQDENCLAQEVQLERYETDPWEENINNYIETRNQVSIPEILANALDLKERDWTKMAEMRVGKHLTMIGRKRVRRRAPNGAQQWYYIKRPDYN